MTVIIINSIKRHNGTATKPATLKWEAITGSQANAYCSNTSFSNNTGMNRQYNNISDLSQLGIYGRNLSSIPKILNQKKKLTEITTLLVIIRVNNTHV